MDRSTGRAERLTLTPTAGNVGRARSWLADALGRSTRLAVPQIEAATIMISELVTNVFTHADAEAEVSFTVLDDGHVRVAVRDAGAGEPEIQPFDPMRIGGNGLRIVQAMSRSWGVEHHPEGGKTVWFVTGGRDR